jgi:hypothetical protein
MYNSCPPKSGSQTVSIPGNEQLFIRRLNFTPRQVVICEQLGEQLDVVFVLAATQLRLYIYHILTQTLMDDISLFEIQTVK